MKQVLFLVFFLCTACQREGLSVYTDLMDKGGRASFFVRTPDPDLNDAYFLHRLIASWRLSPEDWKKQPLILRMKIRYGTKEEEIKEYPVKQRRGHQAYDLTGDELLEKEGILTYRVEIVSADEVLHDFEHQIWEERIRLHRGEFDSPLDS